MAVMIRKSREGWHFTKNVVPNLPKRDVKLLNDHSIEDNAKKKNLGCGVRKSRAGLMK